MVTADQHGLPRELRELIVKTLARALAADYRRRHEQSGVNGEVQSGNEPQDGSAQTCGAIEGQE